MQLDPIAVKAGVRLRALAAVGSTNEEARLLAKRGERGPLWITAVAQTAGREGELIFRYIYEAAGCSKPFSRLWISSLTPDAIRRGFETLRPGRDYDGLADAARGRDPIVEDSRKTGAAGPCFDTPAHGRG